MPGWITHIDVATKLSQKLVLDKDKFLIGNVMPDAEKWVVNDFSVFVPWSISHFGQMKKIDKFNISLPNIENYISLYKDKLDNPIVLGYLSHLLTDYYYNKETYTHHLLVDDAGNRIGVSLKNRRTIYCKPRGSYKN